MSRPLKYSGGLEDFRVGVEAGIESYAFRRSYLRRDFNYFSPKIGNEARENRPVPGVSLQDNIPDSALPEVPDNLLFHVRQTEKTRKKDMSEIIGNELRDSFPCAQIFVALCKKALLVEHGVKFLSQLADIAQKPVHASGNVISKLRILLQGVKLLVGNVLGVDLIDKGKEVAAPVVEPVEPRFPEGMGAKTVE